MRLQVGRRRDDVGRIANTVSLLVIVLIGLVNSSAAAVDAALIASVLGILATVALARILTKGRR